MIWQTTRHLIDLTQPRVMGIVNLTPDSFSDGGRYFSAAGAVSQALAHCEALLRDGADILDIGGESTRPGAVPVPLYEELARVLPVLHQAVTLGVPVSVDTYKPAVMQAALDMGADIINDIWALRQPGAAQVVAAHPSCGVCLMHMHREPLSMQAQPMTGDVLAQVKGFLAGRVTALTDSGVPPQRLVLDPGIGFGKTAAQNFTLLARQKELLTLGLPLLAGWSRKSSLAFAGGDSSGNAQPPDRRVASVAAALLAIERGARVVRVHDVRETAQAREVWLAVRRQDPDGIV